MTQVVRHSVDEIDNKLLQFYISYLWIWVYGQYLTALSEVGKTSLMQRYFKNEFIEDCCTTIGVDFQFKDVDINGEKYRLQCFDPAGQERFRTMGLSFYRGADCFFLVYDVNNRKTFQEIGSFLEEIRGAFEESVLPPIILVGNKIDLNSREVTQEEADTFVKEKDLLTYIETSAKTNENVKGLFDLMMEQLELRATLEEKKKETENFLKAFDAKLGGLEAHIDYLGEETPKGKAIQSIIKELRDKIAELREEKDFSVQDIQAEFETVINDARKKPEYAILDKHRHMGMPFWKYLGNFLLGVLTTVGTLGVVPYYRGKFGGFFDSRTTTTQKLDSLFQITIPTAPLSKR